MSSEALPLIFEPFEDVTRVPGGAQPPAAMATGGAPQSEVDLGETDGDGPSHLAPSLLMPDWTSPWQTSGGELLQEPIGSQGPSASREDHAERGDE